MDRFASIDALKGVGEKSKKLLEKLSICTVDDLLTYYPRDYRKCKGWRNCCGTCRNSWSTVSAICKENADYDSTSER